MPEKGVLLVNLGTPDAPEKGSVGQFLTEFLSDPRVVDLPRWFWIPLLRLVIIPLRKGRTTGAYKKIWLADGSPLLVYSEALCAGLQRLLGSSADVRVAMRYGAIPIIRLPPQNRFLTFCQPYWRNWPGNLKYTGSVITTTSPGGFIP